MADFVHDTFTGSGPLDSHTGETGASWTQWYNSGGGIYIASNLLYAISNYALYQASGTPPGAEYYVRGTVRFLSAAANCHVDLYARMTNNGSNGYSVRADNSGVSLIKTVSYAQTVLATVPQTWTPNVNHSIWFEVKDATKKVFLDGVEIISSTDNSLTSAGGVGVMLAGPATPSTGWILDDIRAAPNGSGPPSPPTAGMLSVATTSSTAATIGVTACSGGTAPFNYQYQRATDIDGSPSSYVNIGTIRANVAAGTDPSTYHDTGRTAGSTYWYRCIVTDSEYASAISNAVSVTFSASSSGGGGSGFMANATTQYAAYGDTKSILKTKVLENFSIMFGWVTAGSSGGSSGGGGGGDGSVPTDDVAILAEVRDNTPASIDLRLGPQAPAGMSLPTVWQRPLVRTFDSGFGVPFMGDYSEGLYVNGSGVFDYGSTATQIIAGPDNPLVITPSATSPNAVPNDGLGLYRLRTEEHAQGQVNEAPVVAWNGQFIDLDSYGHIRNGLQGNLGRPFACARGKVNRYDCGVALYDESRGGVGYFGVIGTETARQIWSGTTLPSGKVPLSIAVSSYNEFVFVGVHDIATGKGQIGVYWNWAGQDLQALENGGNSFPFDFPKAHPGLVNSGVVTGVKLFGFFDLPIKWPTNIDCVVENAGSDRIQGPDGNASYLNIWQLDTDAQRTAFLAQNSAWIAHWGKACAVSKYESQAVMIDFTELFAGVRDQYFGSQANYDQTAYNTPGGGNGWNAYGWTDPMLYPWGVEKKPEWAPAIGDPIDIPSVPKAMVMSEHGDAQVAIATADGNVRFYTFDGSPNGVIHVGDNPVHITLDKGFPSSGTRRVDALGPIVTCRASRSVVMLDSWGPSAAIAFTLQDDAMIDPVACEAGDVHGLQMRYWTICDFSGKTVRNYRLTNLILATQGGAVFGLGPDGLDSVECGGVMNIPGKPFALSGSNVN